MTFSKNSLSVLLNFLFSRLLIFTLGISFGSSYNSLLLYIFLSLGREVALKSCVCLCMFACLCVYRCTCIYVHVDVEAGRQCQVAFLVTLHCSFGTGSLAEPGAHY